MSSSLRCEENKMWEFNSVLFCVCERRFYWFFCILAYMFGKSVVVVPHFFVDWILTPFWMKYWNSEFSVCLRKRELVLILLIFLDHVCRSVCLVGNVATVLRTALTRVKSLQIGNCVTIVEKWDILWLTAPNLFKMVCFLSIEFCKMHVPLCIIIP